MAGLAAYLLLFATISAVVASKKDRNVAGFFILGLFTGVVGLLVLVALPRKGGEKCETPLCESGVSPGAGEPEIEDKP